MTNMRQPLFLLFRQQLPDCVAYPPVLEMLVRISPEIAQHPKIELDDGWPESVEEQGLLLLVWRRNFRNGI